MSNKQIEEMVKDVCNSIVWDRDEFAQIDCLETAYLLYKKGYRKQSEGEWITKHRHRGGFRTVYVVDRFGEKHKGTLDDRWECNDLYCSVCGRISHDAFLNYCANCGAKMKGGAEE